MSASTLKYYPPVPSPQSFAHILQTLGGISPDRVRFSPMPGSATIEDAIRINESDTACELVNGTIVELPVGNREDFFGSYLGGVLMMYVIPRNLGIVTMPRGQFTLKGGSVREPDVAFTILSRVIKPVDKICYWCPDLCVEVLSDSNTRTEMQIKRQEYFASGCRVVWEFDAYFDRVWVYESPETGRELAPTEMLECGEVISGFSYPVGQLFAEFRTKCG